MRYIRTKEGRIIDLKNWTSVDTIYLNAETNEEKKDICYQRGWFEYHEHGDACQYKTEYISHNNDVLKQADTIEELCDEFRGIWEDEKEDAHEEYYYNKEKDVFYDDFEELTHKEAIEKFDMFYGAIWTKWGLKYAAKMNENGELEVL